MNNVFIYEGESGFSGTFFTAELENGIARFSKDLLSVPELATFWIMYQDGSIAAPIIGERFSSTDGRSFVLVGYTRDGGSIPTEDMSGIFLIKQVTFPISKVYQYAVTFTGDLSGAEITVYDGNTFIPVLTKSTARVAIINVTSDDGINYSTSGCIPSSYVGPRTCGIYLPQNGTIIIRGEKNISNFQCVSGLNATYATVRYELLF